MHVEGNTLFVCTKGGLLSKDISDNSSEWQLVGFEGIPLQDYARRGNEIIALRYNKGGGFLLLSQDDGQTFEDITPSILSGEKHDVLPGLAQHPADSSTLIVSSIYWGIFRTMDFGHTWDNITEYFYGNAIASYIGFHNTLPSIIYNCGEGGFFEGHIYISYNNGQTWYDHGESLGYNGDNCVHRPSFHPINSDRWFAGGNGCSYSTDDNGSTWRVNKFNNDTLSNTCWLFSLFDGNYPDTIYMVGYNKERITLVYSLDGGNNWTIPQAGTISGKVNDFRQYGDNLLVYTETDVFMISKTDLFEQTTSVVRNNTINTTRNPELYDLYGRKQTTKHSKGIFILKGQKILE